MRRVVAVLLLLAVFSAAETLPDAPSTSHAASTQTQHSVSRVEDAHGVIYWNTADRSFTERHRKAIIWGGIGLGVTVGVIVGILKHSGNCPSMIWYDGRGYPYKGTYDDQHACPTEPPGVKH